MVWVSAFPDKMKSLGWSEFCLDNGWLREGDTQKLKTIHPNKNSLHKQFAQTLSAYFLLILLTGKRVDNLYKLFRHDLRKLCFYLGGCFFGWVSPSWVSAAPPAEAHPRNLAVHNVLLWELLFHQQLKKGVFGKGSFRNLCAELCFVFFYVLRWFSPANLTEISFRNRPSNAGIFWRTPSLKTPKRSCWFHTSVFHVDHKCDNGWPASDGTQWERKGFSEKSLRLKAKGSPVSWGFNGAERAERKTGWLCQNGGEIWCEILHENFLWRRGNLRGPGG